MHVSLADLALLAAAATAGIVAAAGAECTSTSPLLSVTSARNATGHLATTVRLQQETRLPAPAAALAIDVHPTTTRCRGARTDALLITLHTPPLPPGPGYEEFPGAGYYKLHEELKNWVEAKAICEDEDAHMLVLNSEGEAAAIQQLILRHPNITYSYIFIGFHDRDKEGHYVTIFGENLASTGFLRWHSGQPDDKNGSYNCGTVERKTVALNDVSCSDKRPFICEQIVA